MAEHYTVLGNAEAYMHPAVRSRMGGSTTPHRTIDEARDALLPQLDTVKADIQVMPRSQRLDEVVVEMRLDVSRMAKSYHPHDLLREAGLHVRGVTSWPQALTGDRALKERRRGHVLESQDAPGEPARAVVSSRALLVSGTEDAIGALHEMVRGSSEGGRHERDIIGIEGIRVPTIDDHLAVRPTTDPSVAVEIVLYAWDDAHRDEAVDAVRRVLSDASPQRANEILVRPYAGGPTFIAGIVPASALPLLGSLNFLRLTRPLPRVMLTRTALGMAVPAPAVGRNITAPTAAIAVFDGGVAMLPHFQGLVHYTELTSKPCTPKLLDHGTGVVSAAIYGHLVHGQPLPAPKCQVYAYRVLPDPVGSELELWGVIDKLEEHVPRLPAEVKLINLSMGPEDPIHDVPTRFTYAIDRLSYEHDKLFVMAVGNWGAMQPEALRRIQAPSDAVNGLAVGAFTRDPTSGKRKRAAYTCVGPGRTGCVRKPDLDAFGGDAGVPFYALSAQPGQVVGTDGTSFGAPLITALGGQLCSGRTITTQGCRALLLHARTAQVDDSGHALNVTPESLEEVLACSAKRVSVLYQGRFSPRQTWRLPFLLPTSVQVRCNVTLAWTIVYGCEVDESAPDEYTLGGIEVQLRPNANVYTWSKPKMKGLKPVELHVARHADTIASLEADGWKRSENPVSDSRRSKQTERVLRAAEAKWETVLRGASGKQGPGLEDPALTVSFHGRGVWADEKTAGLILAPFAAVLTISADHYEGNLYAEVAKVHSQLRAFAIANRAAIPVSIGRQTPPPNP